MQYEESDINLGEIIKEGLRKKEISQMELAKMMGVSPSLVSGWVKNHRIPTGKDIIKIAIILDIVSLIFPGYTNTWHKIEGSEETKGVFAAITKEIENLREKDHHLEQKISRLEQILGRHYDQIASLLSSVPAP